MKGAIGFGFFILFIAGFALVNLKSMQEQSGPSISDLSSPAWRVTHLGETRLSDESKIQLQFDAEGQVSGFAGAIGFSANIYWQTP